MRILLIGNAFFGYADRVTMTLRQLGHKVDLIFTYSPTYIERIEKKFMNKNVSGLDYYRKKIAELSNNEYDLIFVFGGGCPKIFLENLKNDFDTTPFVLYMSADLTSYKFNDDYLAIFNRIFTYSAFDAQDNRFIYQPWFFSDTSHVRKKYDISFVGSLHDNRYQFLSSLDGSSILSSNIYVYADVLTFLNSFKKWKNLYSSIHFKGLNYKSYIELLGMSRVTLDIPEKGQKNITTRPIESLGTNTKIITTNNNIVEYDFYNDNNIKIISEPEDILGLKDWIATPYTPLEENIVMKYNIINWCNEILARIQI